MKKLLLLFALFFPFLTGAQFNFSLDSSVPVSVDGKSLSDPWAGGLNSAQYNTMDVNLDGKPDLVLFDRFAQKVVTFIRQDNGYKHFPEYESLFPDKVRNWLLLRDFNCDGKKDIFTGDILGIRVFLNTSSATAISWKPFYFYAGTARSEVVLTRGRSGKINLQLQFDDIPSIGDADGDGDIDIFAMDYGGGGTIELHRNFSQEDFGRCDSLELRMVTDRWGGVSECDCAEFAFNDQPCPETPGGRVAHAGGKALTAFDANRDGQLDMLLSEAECDRLSLLSNGGTSVNALITGSADFPPATPATFPRFPAAFFEDVDQDGATDLVVTPGLFSKDVPQVDFARSNWFYRNSGSNAAPVFTFQGPDFLQNTMIEVGDNAVPALADLEGDGDLDLFVAGNLFPSRIYLFRNVGTAVQPAFELEDDDFLNLAAANLRNLRLSLADINQNGTTDLIYSATLPSNVTELYYLNGRTRNRLDVEGVTPVKINFSFPSADNLSFVDVNSDGRLDILRGRSNGQLEYWRNTGNITFALENSQYLGYGPSVFETSLTCVAADLNADGAQDLVIGDQTGRLKVIPDFRTSNRSAAIEEIILNTVSSGYYAPNLGGRLFPAAANLFGTPAPAIIAGTSLGGLRLLRGEGSSSGKFEVVFSPNPVIRNGTVDVHVTRPSSLEIFDAQGRLIRYLDVVPPFVTSELKVAGLSSGVYLLRFRSNSSIIVRRLVVY